MGQRSQIYVRYNGDLIIANYYGWNYGERMISRARHGIEMLENYSEEKYSFVFDNLNYVEKMRRIFDVNFDMGDYIISSNIFNEWKDVFSDIYDFKDFCFHNDNNNGKLLIDINKNKIKYAFIDYSNEKVMSAREYMKWDCHEEWDNVEKNNKKLDKEAIDTCLKNISEIKKMANLMSKEEVHDFLNNSRTLKLWELYDKGSYQSNEYRSHIIDVKCDANNNVLYREWSNGFKEKYEYNDMGKFIKYEDSNGYERENIYENGHVKFKILRNDKYNLFEEYEYDRDEKLINIRTSRDEELNIEDKILNDEEEELNESI